MARIFPILAQTDHWVVIAKPAGMIVHRSRMARDRHNVLRHLRNQLDRYLHPIHRLDRQVSGCLLFAFDKQWARDLQAAIVSPDAKKTYLAFVRGEIAHFDPVLVDNPMKDDNGILKTASSTIQCVATSADPRCSLVQIQPHTGRYHQVRRHIRDLCHPVLGDSMHGDSRINRWWRENHGLPRLGLHCLSLDLPLPDGSRLSATCPVPDDLRELWQRMPWWDDAVGKIPTLKLLEARPPDIGQDDV
jgi:tRNA pseudouridine65 synthase